MGTKPSDQISQYARFVETARAIGCDEDEAAFDEKLKKLVPPSSPLSRAKPASSDANRKSREK